MISISLNRIQQIITEINKKESVISINPVGFVFCIVEVHKHFPMTEFWLFDTWLIKYVGVVKVDREVSELRIYGQGIYVRFKSLRYPTSTLFNLNEFVVERNYKQWVKTYEEVISTWSETGKYLSTYLMTHPAFNQG